jgi:hypothetical protein
MLRFEGKMLSISTVMYILSLIVAVDFIYTSIIGNPNMVIGVWMIWCMAVAIYCKDK